MHKSRGIHNILKVTLAVAADRVEESAQKVNTTLKRHLVR